MRKILLGIVVLITANQLIAQNKLIKLNSFDTLNLSLKSTLQISEAFEIINGAPIYFSTKREIANNCENRAQLSAVILEKLGFNPINFWIFKEGLIEDKFNTTKKVKKSRGLKHNTKIGRKPFVFWTYHVATGIMTEQNGTQIVYIFDPWTQNKLVNLETWSLSFFANNNDRTAYVLPVTESYKHFGKKKFGKVSLKKSDWTKHLDENHSQMYCGLAGITPNNKCEKKRFKKRILNRKKEITRYLNTYNIKL